MKRTIRIPAFILLFAMISVLLVSCGGGAPAKTSEEYPIWAYIEIVKTKNMSLIDDILPEPVDSYKDTFELMKTYAKETLEEAADEAEGYNISYKIVETTAASDEKLAEAGTMYKDISEAKKIKVELTKEKDGKSETDTEEYVIVKQSGNWKLFD